MENDSKKIIPIIISKTLIFIFVILAVMIFQKIFKTENSLVGVSSITLTLVLLEIDLTRNPMKNLLYLTGFNLVLGLGAFVVNQSIWIGLVINFIIMFAIGYLFTYELRKSISMLVGLHYVFMITSPVTLQQLPIRLLALIAGPFIVMGVQLLVNRNKLVKLSKKTIDSIEDSIFIKIDLFIKKKDTNKIDTTISKSINNLKINIYNTDKNESEISGYEKIIINVLSCLEKINTLLDSIDKNNEKFLNDTVYWMKNGEKKILNTSYFEDVNLEYKENYVNELGVCELITTLEILSEEKEKLYKLSNIKKSKNIKQIKLLGDFKHINICKKNIDVESNRVAYGIRLGIVISITSFITSLFDLEFGRWMIYTVLVLTQPYAEYTKARSKKRLIGTIIGAVIVFILFNLAKTPESRSIIMLAAGYLSGYVSDYRDIVIFNTISAISSAAIDIYNPSSIIIIRILFVLIAVMISVLANKFIFQRKYKHEEIKLKNIQNKVIEKMLEEVLVTGNGEDSIENLFLIPALIENRVEFLELNVEKEVLNKSRNLVNDIYQVNLIGYKYYPDTMYKVKQILNDMYNIESVNQSIKELMYLRKDIKEKILLWKILDILMDKSLIIKV